MGTVLLPQAVRAMLPTIVSQLVVLLKDTALGFLITYPELLFEARYLGGLAEVGRPSIPSAIVIALVVRLIDPALGFLITSPALLFEARYLGGLAEFGRPIIPTAIVVAAVYITLCLLLSWMAKYLEQRNRRTGRYARAKPAAVETPKAVTIETLGAE